MSTFNEKKATQAAGRMLAFSGRRMNGMKLNKLLYLADREAILRWGDPVTTDCFVFMKHGPVLSQIHTLMAEGHDPRLAASVWSAAISRPQDGEVALQGTTEFSQLSGAESDLLGDVFQGHGSRTPWELADLTRRLPEWRDPKGSAIPFGVRELLAACGGPRTLPAQAEDEPGISLVFCW